MVTMETTAAPVVASLSLEERVDAAAWASMHPDAGMAAEVRYHLWWLAAALTWRPMVPRWISALVWLLVVASVPAGWAVVQW